MRLLHRAKLWMAPTNHASTFSIVFQSSQWLFNSFASWMATGQVALRILFLDVLIISNSWEIDRPCMWYYHLLGERMSSRLICILYAFTAYHTGKITLMKNKDVNCKFLISIPTILLKKAQDMKCALILSVRKFTPSMMIASMNTWHCSNV